MIDTKAIESSLEYQLTHRLDKLGPDGLFELGVAHLHMDTMLDELAVLEAADEAQKDEIESLKQKYEDEKQAYHDASKMWYGKLQAADAERDDALVKLASAHVGWNAANKGWNESKGEIAILEQQLAEDDKLITISRRPNDV